MMKKHGLRADMFQSTLTVINKWLSLILSINISICFIYLSIDLSVCLFIWIFVCLSIEEFLIISVSMRVGRNHNIEVWRIIFIWCCNLDDHTCIFSVLSISIPDGYLRSVWCRHLYCWVIMIILKKKKKNNTPLIKKSWNIEITCSFYIVLGCH